VVSFSLQRSKNFLIAEEILSAALQEDVDVIGISSSSRRHMPVFDDLLEGMRKQSLDDVLLVGGGIIPPRDIARSRRQA